MDERKRRPSIVTGHIVLDKSVKSFSGAIIYVSLEYITMQYTRSKLITQQMIKDVSYYFVDYDDITCNQKKLYLVLWN
jgi:hypothetical protein